MKSARRTTVAIAVLLALGGAASDAQITTGRPEVGGFYDEEKYHVELSESNWRVGLGVGPSISTRADLIADFRAQERLYVRRQFSDLLQAEAGVGIHRIAGDHMTPEEHDVNFWSFDGRFLIAPSIDDQWNPYGFVGVGYAIHRMIDEPEDPIASEADVATPETGGGVILPLGIGVQFKPARQSRIAVDMNLGYSTIFNDAMDGTAGGANASFIQGMVSLEYLFHDSIERRTGLAKAE